MPRRRSSSIKMLTWLTDLAVPVIAFSLAYSLFPDAYPVPDIYYQALAASVLLSALYFPLVSLYRPRRGERLLAEVRNMVLAVAALFATLALLGIATRVTLELSRVWFALWFGITLAGLISYRLLLRTGLRWLRSLGFNRRHVVLIGHRGMGANIQAALQDASWSGFYIDKVYCADGDSCALIEQWDEISAHLQTNHVDQVWLALPLRDIETVTALADRMSQFVVDVRYSPDSQGAEVLKGSLVSVAGLPMLNLSLAPIEPGNMLLKELEDRILAALILVIVSPFMLGIALAVKASSRGPIFYKQERLGWGGAPIQMYKFRSMPVDAELQSGPVWNKRSDDRATALGAFLRRTSLDELPQLFNVLKGEMSLVGPRPERPVFVEKFKHEVPGYMQKHRVKAGITGWAQINGWRGNTDLNKRIEHDLYYIRNWSLFFDIKILVLTVFRGFVNKNAY